MSPHSGTTVSWQWYLIITIAALTAVILGVVGVVIWQWPPSRELEQKPDMDSSSSAQHPSADTNGAETVHEATRPEPGDADDPLFGDQRRQMVRRQLEARDIADPAVISAMLRVPRHTFVPDGWRDCAYVDSALPIAHGQTISQPYIVALMTQLVRPQRPSRVLDVGTGSGYQAAVLAEIVSQVYGIEIIEPLATEARQRLQSLGYTNVEIRHGDGYQGWPEHAPFDAIVVAAAPDHIPQPLVDQLAAGGRMVIPVGRGFQDLILIEKRADGTVSERRIAPVAFVPMTGEAQR